MAEQAKAKVYGSVKRFGVRYGTKLKGKIAKIELERHLSTKCPYCHYNKAKRESAGIWHCSKCNNTFTGKAYSFALPKPAEETAEKSPVGEAVPAEAELREEEENYEEQEQDGTEEESRSEN